MKYTQNYTHTHTYILQTLSLSISLLLDPMTYISHTLSVPLSHTLSLGPMTYVRTCTHSLSFSHSLTHTMAWQTMRQNHHLRRPHIPLSDFSFLWIIIVMIDSITKLCLSLSVCTNGLSYSCEETWPKLCIKRRQTNLVSEISNEINISCYTEYKAFGPH